MIVRASSKGIKKMINSIKSNLFQPSKAIIELSGLESPRRTGTAFPSRALWCHSGMDAERSRTGRRYFHSRVAAAQRGTKNFGYIHWVLPDRQEEKELQGLATPRVAHVPIALIPLRNSGLAILGPYPRTTQPQSKSRSAICLSRPTGGLWCTVEFENHWYRICKVLSI